jgi:hypothetical protein
MATPFLFPCAIWYLRMMTTAAEIVNSLLEADELDPKAFVSRATDHTLPEEGDPTVRISIGKWGCVEDDHGNVSQVMVGQKPQFWSVYKFIHFFDQRGREQMVEPHWVSDWPTPQQAEMEQKRLENFHRAEGTLYTSHLLNGQED